MKTRTSSGQLARQSDAGGGAVHHASLLRDLYDDAQEEEQLAAREVGYHDFFEALRVLLLHLCLVPRDVDSVEHDHLHQQAHKNRVDCHFVIAYSTPHFGQDSRSDRRVEE